MINEKCRICNTGGPGLQISIEHISSGCYIRSDVDFHQLLQVESEFRELATPSVSQNEQ